MQYVTIPNTELSVSRLCFGCWGVVSDAHWGKRSERDSMQAMRSAVDAGINFFDTAPMYGQGSSEVLLGKFLQEHDLREKVVVGTKIRPDRMRPEQVIEECEASLERLQVECIDLYQTHWTDPNVPIEDTWEAMGELQNQGKIRYPAVCNAGVGDLGALSSPRKPVTNQLPYNLLWRAIEWEILAKCRAEEIGILAYSPLLHGILSGEYQTADDVPEGRARTRHFASSRSLTRHGEPGCEALTFETLEVIQAIARTCGLTMSALSLAWLLAKPQVTSVIVGAKNEQQVCANVEAASLLLSDDVLQRLDEATAPLMQQLGANPDMWDGNGQGRFH